MDAEGYAMCGAPIQVPEGDIERPEWDEVVKSGPFWGNMLNAIYRKL